MWLATGCNDDVRTIPGRLWMWQQKTDNSWQINGLNSQLTDAVEDFAHIGSLQDVLGTQNVSDEAADYHKDPHRQVRHSRQQAVLQQ